MRVMRSTVITHVLATRANNKMYRIKYEDEDVKYITLPELNILVPKKDPASVIRLLGEVDH